MNLRLLAKLLGIISMLIGGTMVFSLPWAHPALGRRNELTETAAVPVFETHGFMALLGSLAVCFAVGALLMWLGRKGQGRLYRKEAMAVVGLSWVLATVLGGLPFYLSGAYYRAAVRLPGEEDHGYALIFELGRFHFRQQEVRRAITPKQHTVVKALLAAGAKGLAPQDLPKLAKSVNPAKRADPPSATDVLENLARRDAQWRKVLIFPGSQTGPRDRVDNYRIRWVRMGVVNSL